MHAASYTFEQASWAGGLDGGIFPAHPTNESGWAKYSSKDATTTISGSAVTVSLTSGSKTQTTDTDFNAGTFTTTAESGSGSAGSVILSQPAQGTVDTWSTVANYPINSNGTGYAEVGVNGSVYSIQGGLTNPATFYRYSVSGNNYTQLATLPVTPAAGTTMYYPGSGDFIYASIGNAGSSGTFYRYSISGNSWAQMATPPATAFTGSGLAGSGDFIYLLRAAFQTGFYRYSISGNSWSTMASLPFAAGQGGGLVYPGSGNFLYAMPGDGTNTFWRYSISGNSWSTMTGAPATFASGAYLASPGSTDFIYAQRGNGGVTFMRYSISGNSWTTLGAMPFTPQGTGSQLVYPGSGNLFYELKTGSNLFYQYDFALKYNSSGTFTSSAIDLGQNSTPTTFNYSATAGSGTSIQFQMRSAQTSVGLSSATWYGPTGTGDFYTSSGQTINSVHSGDRYFQYKASLSTTNVLATPTLSDETINYNAYPATSTLTSSPYNAGDAHNVVSSISWTAATSASTSVMFQIRSAPDSSGTPGTFSAFVGPDGTSNTYFASSTGGDSTPAALATNSQWFQYKAYLTNTDGLTTPASLTDVQVRYVVNAAPQFNPDYPATGDGGVSASENTTGTVDISYSILDSDTSTGTVTPGFVTPTFQYSLNNGSTWSDVDPATLLVSDSANKAVNQVGYTNYTATWSAASQIAGQYSTTAMIRAIVNDNESANNIASSTSAAFTLDTKAPVLGGQPITVDASQSPAAITLSVTDDSSFQMKLGKVSDLSDGSYVTYSSPTTLSFSSGNTVYAQFKDAFNNSTSIISDTPPVAPSNIFYQDTSDVNTSEWREFFAWGVADEPSNGFGHYAVYRSVNGGAYALLTTISNRQVNFIVDTGLSTASTYSYKVATVDAHGDISPFSAQTTIDTPDGVGGSDLAAPTLTSVHQLAITTTGATITWTTNKLANSTIYYIATTTYPGSDKSLYTTSVGVPSMTKSHSVTLSGLSPNTQYYFLAESQDSSDNTGQSSDSTYTFTTEQGPVISNVSASQVANTQVTITWNTDAPSDSTVFYSLNPDLSSPQHVTGSGSLTTSHSVTVTGLTLGTTYYYYVESVDGSSNVGINKNVVSGTIEYFTFNTTNDTSPLLITDVSAQVGETGATILWTTDKSSNSHVSWGITSDLGNTTATSSSYTTQHAVFLSGLSTSTQYYYEVSSEDQSSNYAKDDNGGQKYSFTTLSPSNSTTTITQFLGGGGGGGSVDVTPPNITNVSVVQTAADAVTVTFSTSLIANAVVKYGTAIPYSDTAGDATVYQLSHSINLSGLVPLGTYHFSITSANIYGVSNSSSDASFTLKTFSDSSDNQNLYTSQNPVATSTAPSDASVALTADEQSIIDKLKSASAGMIQAVLNALTENTNLASVPEGPFASIVSDLSAKVVSAPTILGADIIVNPGSNSARISWSTDKPTNSLVSYSDNQAYNPSDPDSYTISAGLPDDSVSKHDVVLTNLNPSTTYHFQVRSQGPIGAPAFSPDRTFKTTSAQPQIFNVSFQDIGETSADVQWTTDVPTKTKINLKNTRTGVTSSDTESEFEVDHTYSFKNLDISAPYTITFVASDASSTPSNPLVVPFNTVLSGKAPKISNVRITTSLIPGNVQTAQTIVSWNTDKPSSSQIFFDMGSLSDMPQSTPLDPNFTQNHVVITTLLHPGTVYAIKAESADSSNNVTDSDPYTVLTPAPAGSIVDLILGNLKGTFGVFTK